jgi:hypothetical protein
VSVPGGGDFVRRRVNPHRGFPAEVLARLDTLFCACLKEHLEKHLLPEMQAINVLGIDIATAVEPQEFHAVHLDVRGERDDRPFIRCRFGMWTMKHSPLVGQSHQHPRSWALSKLPGQFDGSNFSDRQHCRPAAEKSPFSARSPPFVGICALELSRHRQDGG